MTIRKQAASLQQDYNLLSEVTHGSVRTMILPARSSRHLSEFTQYTAVSGAALVLDYAIYWSLASSGTINVGSAAAAGYSIGLVFAYVAMSGRLFKNGWLAGHKVTEATLFALSGLIGVILSYAITESYFTFVAEDIHYAKLIATLISFGTVYAFRKFIIFRRAHCREPLA